MSSRRQRPSLGPIGQGGPSKAAWEHMDDFRRRHIKQNKEVVIDNTLRKITIKALQDEVAKLHVEVLQLRETNLALCSKMKRMEVKASQTVDQSTRNAIDQILSAVPALRLFRDSLTSVQTSSTLPGSGATQGSSWVMENKENPAATKPAASGAGMRQLNTLEEATEYESESSQPDVVERRIRRVSAGRRRTEIGSIAVSRSPRPNLARNPPSDLFVVDTPSAVSPSRSRASSSSCSPSPVKVAHRSPSKEKRQRKRRESGCLQIPPRGNVTADEEGVEEVQDWEEGGNVVIPPPKTALAPKSKTEKKISPTNAEDEVVTGLDASITTGSLPDKTAAVPTSKIPWRTKKAPELVVGVAEGVDGVIGGKGRAKAVEALAIVEAVEAGAMGTQQAPPATSPSAVEADIVPSSEADFLASLADEDGGRGRRARRSVNYKEPSLTKKMRKPDGTPIEEVLRSRASLSATPQPDSLFSGETVAARSLQMMSGPRRKSVLPKAGQAFNFRKAAENSSTDEDEGDLTDCDDLQELDLEAREEEKEEQQVVSAISAVNAVPTNKPAARSMIASTKRLPTNRLSPRKLPVKPATGSGAGRPATTARVVSGSRMALTDRPTENGQKTASETIVKASLTTRKPTTVAGRRASAILQATRVGEA